MKRQILFVTSIAVCLSLLFIVSCAPKAKPAAPAAQTTSTAEAPRPGSAAAELEFAKDPKIKDPKVAVIQDALNRKGAKLEVDGVMGRKTKRALRKFQRENNLKATGKLDDETRKALGLI